MTKTRWRGAIRDLALQARYYKRLIDPAAEPDEQTRAGLQRLARWGAQTAHPVLMVALDLHRREVISVQDLRQVVAADRVLLRAPSACSHPNQRPEPGVRPAHRQAAGRRVVRRRAA